MKAKDLRSYEDFPTISITLDLYSHVTETMQKDAAIELDKAFRATRTGGGNTK